MPGQDEPSDAAFLAMLRAAIEGVRVVNDRSLLLIRETETLVRMAEELNGANIRTR